MVPSIQTQSISPGQANLWHSKMLQVPQVAQRFKEMSYQHQLSIQSRMFYTWGFKFMTNQTVNMP